MPTLDFVGTATPTVIGQHVIGQRGLAVIQLHNDLWRVTLPAGDVLGYVERFPVAGGDRFRAKKFLPRQRRFIVDGEFWSIDDALSCFH